MSIDSKINRRGFIRQATMLGTTLAVSPFLSTDLFGSSAPKGATPRKIGSNERVNIACIGIGNRGAQIINEFEKTGLATVVALCDTDMGAPHTTKIMAKYPDAARFQDFRVMFDKMASKIDAVIIGVPDHTHFPITMLSMSLGKHVYVEKPMARTFQQVELMMAAAKRHGVVTQMGNQGHSGENYFQFKAWKEAGIIKDVTAISAHMNNPRRWHKWSADISGFPAPQTKPSTLDWECWLGAAQDHGYHKDYINGQWRCWYDYGMGALGDWGAHILDSAHEFLDLGLPFEVSMLYAKEHNNFFYPKSSTILFRFPERKFMPPVDITWYDGLDNLPPIPQGYGTMELGADIPAASTGMIKPSKLNPGKIIYTKDLTFKGGTHSAPLTIIPEQRAAEMASQLPHVPESSSNHYANFLLACRGDETTRSPFSIAGPLSQVFCLGVLAQMLNTTLKFDRQTKQITNNPMANLLLTGAAPRKGWEEYYKL